MKALRDKFHVLYRTTPPTGSGQVPRAVERAKQIVSLMETGTATREPSSVRELDDDFSGASDGEESNDQASDSDGEPPVDDATDSSTDRTPGRAATLAQAAVTPQVGPVGFNQRRTHTYITNSFLLTGRSVQFVCALAGPRVTPVSELNTTIRDSHAVFQQTLLQATDSRRISVLENRLDTIRAELEEARAEAGRLRNEAGLKGLELERERFASEQKYFRLAQKCTCGAFALGGEN